MRVRGELSGFKRAASGHLYFTLKDEKACIDAVAWRGSVPKLAFEPADGLEVICTGRLTTYPGRSKYQLVVERIEPAGMGALMALLEERRKRSWRPRACSTPPASGPCPTCPRWSAWSPRPPGP